LAAAEDQGSEEKKRAMMTMGCDFHTRFQQITLLDEATGVTKCLCNFLFLSQLIHADCINTNNHGLLAPAANIA
jgi:hypothetical protein